jgi:CheY-like chemotaxis protein
VTAPEEPAAGSETILLVEDDPSVRQLAMRVLSSMGFTVLEAGSGEEAISICKVVGGRIDLLLTDLVMPGMTGRELADRVHEQRPETRILFMSGYSDEVSGPVVGDAEPIRLLPKPFTPETLARRVRETLEG